MRTPVYLLLVVFLLLQGCAGSKEASRIVKPAEIAQAGYFKPVSFISFIAEGNKAAHHPELSSQAAQLLDSLITQHKGKYRITASLTPPDTALQRRLQKEITAVTFQATKKARGLRVPLSPTLDSLMEARQERFALAFVEFGFSRKKGNYGKEIGKALGIGILTFGWVTPVPTKANTTIHAVLLDSRENMVALYTLNQATDRDPNNAVTVEKQLLKVLSYILLNS